MEKDITFALVLVAGLGMGAQWIAWRLRIPAIIPLIAAGLVAGPWAGWIEPARQLGPLFHPIISLSVAIILFEGGLNLRWHEYREAGADVNRLVAVGLILTWLLGSATAHFVGALSWPVALLFGAIIVVTGPTVIMPLLKQAKLKRRPASLLKWEGIINDPLGALLTVLVFEYFATSGSSAGLAHTAVSLGSAVAVGIGAGFGAGLFLGWSFRRGYVPEYLKLPVMVAAVLALYFAVNGVQSESGLLAVTVFGLVLANLRLRNIEELRRFKEYITILLVSSVFILLTADVDPAILRQLDWRSAALIGLVIFVLRPAVVYLATLGTNISWQERLLVAWIAPRGIVAAAVAGLFGPRMVDLGYSGAAQLLPLVFVLIVSTVLLHGLSIRWVSRRLALASEHPSGLLLIGATAWTVDLAATLRDLKLPVILNDASWRNLQGARMAGARIHPGEILSEPSEETLEFNEVSHLLAATDNDAYNALVCTRFAPELGRNQVMQLRWLPDGAKEHEKLSRTNRGRLAFEAGDDFESLMRRHYMGWRFRKTQLKEQYGFEDLQRDLPSGATLVALLRASGTFDLFPIKGSSVPAAGDTVISYVPPEPSSSKESSKEGAR